MTPAKQRHLTRIRKESAYPTFRAFVNVAAAILYSIGTLGILFSILIFVNVQKPYGDEEKWHLTIATAIFAVAITVIVLGRFVKEIFFVLADIADTLTDLHSRYEQ